jgi:BASS family bile acid:Na+ symporter
MGRVRGHEYGWQVPLAIIIYCVLSQQLSMLVFRLMGWSSPDTVAVGIETTMRNINLAIALTVTIFTGVEGPHAVRDAMWFVALYYAAVAFFAAIPLALRMRRVIRRQQAKAAAASAAEPVANFSRPGPLLPERTNP